MQHYRGIDQIGPNIREFCCFRSDRQMTEIFVSGTEVFSVAEVNHVSLSILDRITVGNNLLCVYDCMFNPSVILQ